MSAHSELQRLAAIVAFYDCGEPFLQFQVLHFHVPLFDPSFSGPAFSGADIWSCVFWSSIFSAPVDVALENNYMQHLQAASLPTGTAL